jgi:Mg2+ and Co2+ transporter CorA
MYCRRCATYHVDKVCPITGRRIDIVKDEQDYGTPDAIITGALDDAVDRFNDAVDRFNDDGGSNHGGTSP